MNGKNLSAKVDGWKKVATVEGTLVEGCNHVEVQAANGGKSDTPAGLILAVLADDGKTVLAHTDWTWTWSTCGDAAAFDCRLKDDDVPPPSVRARFVTLHAIKVSCLHVAEIEVFDEAGANVAAGRKVSMSSYYNDRQFPGENAVDGRTDTFAHTGWKQPPEDAWIQVDLGVVTRVTSVKIHNRKDCCQDRLKGVSFVQFLAGYDGKEVTFTSGLLSGEMVQEISAV